MTQAIKKSIPLLLVIFYFNSIYQIIENIFLKDPLGCLHTTIIIEYERGKKKAMLSILKRGSALEKEEKLYNAKIPFSLNWVEELSTFCTDNGLFFKSYIDNITLHYNIGK